ncbi:hypothetical protein ACIGO9_28630 [Nocardia asteroides]
MLQIVFVSISSAEAAPMAFAAKSCVDAEADERPTESEVGVTIPRSLL